MFLNPADSTAYLNLLNNTGSFFSTPQGYDPVTVGQLPQKYLEQPISMGPTLNPYAPIIRPYIPSPQIFNPANMLPFGLGNNGVFQTAGALVGTGIQQHMQGQGLNYFGPGPQSPVQTLQSRRIDEDMRKFVSSAAYDDSVRFSNYLSRSGLMSPQGAREMTMSTPGQFFIRSPFASMLMPEGTAQDFNRHLFLASRQRLGRGDMPGDTLNALKSLSSDVLGYYTPGGAMDFGRSRGFRLDQLGEIMTQSARYNAIDMGMSYGNMTADQRREARRELMYSTGSSNFGKDFTKEIGGGLVTLDQGKIGAAVDKLRNTRVLEDLKKMNELVRTVAEMSAPGSTIEDLFNNLSKMTGGALGRLNPSQLKRLDGDLKQLKQMAGASGISPDDLQMAMSSGAGQAIAFGTIGSYQGIAGAHALLRTAAVQQAGVKTGERGLTQPQQVDYVSQSYAKYFKSPAADIMANTRAQIAALGDEATPELKSWLQRIDAGEANIGYTVWQNMGPIADKISAVHIAAGRDPKAYSAAALRSQLTDPTLAETNKLAISSVIADDAIPSQIADSQARLRNSIQNNTAATSPIIDRLIDEFMPKATPEQRAALRSSPQLKEFVASSVVSNTFNVAGDRAKFVPGMGKALIEAARDKYADPASRQRLGADASNLMGAMVDPSVDVNKFSAAGTAAYIEAQRVVNRARDANGNPLIDNPTLNTKANAAFTNVGLVGKDRVEIDEVLKNAGVTTSGPLTENSMSGILRRAVYSMTSEAAKSKDQQRSLSEVLKEAVGFTKIPAGFDQIGTILSERRQLQLDTKMDPGDRAAKLADINKRLSGATAGLLGGMDQSALFGVSKEAVGSLDNDLTLISTVAGEGVQAAIDKGLISKQDAERMGLSLDMKGAKGVGWAGSGGKLSSATATMRALLNYKLDALTPERTEQLVNALAQTPGITKERAAEVVDQYKLSLLTAKGHVEDGLAAHMGDFNVSANEISDPLTKISKTAKDTYEQIIDPTKQHINSAGYSGKTRSEKEIEDEQKKLAAFDNQRAKLLDERLKLDNRQLPSVKDLKSLYLDPAKKLLASGDLEGAKRLLSTMATTANSDEDITLAHSMGAKLVELGKASGYDYDEAEIGALGGGDVTEGSLADVNRQSFEDARKLKLGATGSATAEELAALIEQSEGSASAFTDRLAAARPAVILKPGEAISTSGRGLSLEARITGRQELLKQRRALRSQKSAPFGEHGMYGGHTYNPNKVNEDDLTSKEAALGLKWDEAADSYINVSTSAKPAARPQVKPNVDGKDKDKSGGGNSMEVMGILQMIDAEGNQTGRAKLIRVRVKPTGK